MYCRWRRLQEESKAAQRLTGKQWFLQQAARAEHRDEVSTLGSSEVMLR